MADEAIVITDDNYREVLAGTSGVVLFNKKQCPNCKALEKMLDKFFAANPGVGYIHIDSEECPEAMKSFGVERVPTLFVLREGEIAAKKVGLMNVSEMTAFYQAA